eukprot:6164859-Pyramimonas_sp.AAC.1
MHVGQCAAIEHAQIADLGEHGATTPRRAMAVGRRKVWCLLFGLGSSMLEWMFCPRPWTRCVGDAAGCRPLAPDSESESGARGRPRQAAR